MQPLVLPRYRCLSWLSNKLAKISAGFLGSPKMNCCSLRTVGQQSFERIMLTQVVTGYSRGAGILAYCPQSRVAGVISGSSPVISEKSFVCRGKVPFYLLVGFDLFIDWKR